MPDLLPGEAAFRSYYLPSLEGGRHTIQVEQKVSLANSTLGTDEVLVEADKPRKAIAVTQDFTVIAPHFNLIEERVDSVFPPPGQSALPKTLPHIVLKDFHFPWARNAATCARQKDDESNRIPWVALITFTADELQVSDMGIFGDIPGAKLNDNLAVESKVGIAYDKLKLVPASKNVTSLLTKPDSREKDQSTSLIRVQKPLFTKLFTESGKGNISQFKYLNHVRKVATDGQMAAMYGPSGTYSIIVSHRTGPYDTIKATPLIAHLVSLENIDGVDISKFKDNIIMTSLYSWTYTSLPPNSFDVRSALQNLGDNLTVLKAGTPPPKPKPKPKPKPNLDEAAILDIITKRQEDGYTLVRHRTVTGEETAAMYRGPLVPTIVPARTAEEMTIQSNFGTDLQILDADLSLMDISYAAAWQLGKTLAMGDQAFTAALSRVRRQMHTESLKVSQINVHKALGEYMSREALVKSVADLVNGLEGLNSTLHATNETIVSTNRWQAKSVDTTVDISLKSPHIFSQIYENAVPVAMDIASSTSGAKYNYRNVPSNTDYALLQSWVHDKLHLASIPAHYLIPDKSYLPEETLRFFYIDENWTKALTDGALSLANQFTMRPEEDYCRLALKAAIEEYLKKDDPELKYPPQMPKYGFLLRSNVLVQFPDLTVGARFDKLRTAKDEKPKAPILVQRKLAPDTMLCLFDYAPPQLWALKFTLPAQQQMYTVGGTFDKELLTINVKKMYTVDPKKAHDKKKGEALKTNLEYWRTDSEIFDWESRTMKTKAYAKEIHRILTEPSPEGMGDDFTEPQPTSAMMALQLNEPIYTLDIGAIFEEDYARLPDELFSFHAPEFPAHRYKPPPLPVPIVKPRLRPQKLYRPTPESPPISIPRPLVQTVSKPVKKLDRPILNFEVYTLDDNRRKNFVPTNRDLPIDLVFSITTDAQMRETYNYTVKNFMVKIKRAAPAENCPLPLLHEDYEPDPPSMLSNLRFNIFTRFDDDFMYIELVPRSSKGIPLKLVKEASFMLGLVKPYPWLEESATWVFLHPLYRENEGHERDPNTGLPLWDDGVKVDMGPE
ncbi:hypothetical protein TWF730_010040 [Orbilia blumenaviensis]|uniref:Uncharacterized protein n=1 Tax=Orbilia blumenaviensis TaxID=1796055 RepID=A0AAV9UTI4_9PEZI